MIRERIFIIFFLSGILLVSGCNEETPNPSDVCFPNINSQETGYGGFVYEGQYVDSIISNSIHNPWFDGFWPGITVCDSVELNFERNDLEIYKFDVLRSYNCADSCVYIFNVSNPYCEMPFTEDPSVEHSITRSKWNIGYGYKDGVKYHPPCDYINLDWSGKGYARYNSEFDIFQFLGSLGEGDCGNFNMSAGLDTLNQTVTHVGLNGIACASIRYIEQFKLKLGDIMDPVNKPPEEGGQVFNYEIIHNRMIWYNEDSTRKIVWYARDL